MHVAMYARKKCKIYNEDGCTMYVVDDNENRKYKGATSFFFVPFTLYLRMNESWNFFVWSLKEILKFCYVFLTVFLNLQNILLFYFYHNSPESESPLKIIFFCLIVLGLFIQLNSNLLIS